MKKMSEVFKLPSNVLVNLDNELHDDRGRLLAEFSSRQYAKAASHAINHVDALADALELIVNDYNSYRAVNEIDMTDDHCAKLHQKMINADKALAAYRGDK